MDLTKEELKELRAYKTNPDCDEIRCKEIIKRKLLNNKKIIHVLNNKELEDAGAEADEYFGTNILPYYLISPVQSEVQNFICFDVDFDENANPNNKFKISQIVFHILCDQKSIIDTETYIPRHDLLSALLMDEFNWTNYFGFQIHCVSSVSSVVDTYYACKTLVFEMTTYNNITKTNNTNGTRVITSEVDT